jgi:hypothetical protein
MTYQELKSIVANKGYKFFDDGNYNINIIFERTSLIYTDFFKDNCYIAYKVDGEEKVLELPCSTVPGIYWVEHPVTVDGVTGVAIIKEGQYLSCYRFIDDYVTWLNYPFFNQIGQMSYYRDKNLDNILDEVQEQDNKKYSTNFHRGSNVGVTGQHNWNWSMGCVVMEEPYFKQVIELTRESVKVWGNIFSITILESKDFYVCSSNMI